MNILGYECANEEKLNRAVYGSLGREGKLEGAIGENASDELKLAAYDKLGGLITKDTYKVKTGSFYDFGKKMPRLEPWVILVFRDLDGNIVEIPEREIGNLSPEVMATNLLVKKKAEKEMMENERRQKIAKVKRSKAHEVLE